MPKTQQIIWLDDTVMAKLYTLKSLMAPDQATNSFISYLLGVFLNIIQSPEQIKDLINFIKSTSEEYKNKMAALALREQELNEREKKLREAEKERIANMQELSKLRNEIEAKKDEFISIGRQQGKKEAINEIYQLACLQCKQKLKAKYSQ